MVMQHRSLNAINENTVNYHRHTDLQQAAGSGAGN